MSKTRQFLRSFFDIKFWKFILVGLINTVVGMGLQFVLFNLLRWNEFVCSAIGYTVGSIVSYFLNKYFTFKFKGKGWRPVTRFALNIVLCYGIAYGIAIPAVKWICLHYSLTLFNWSQETFAGNASLAVGACLFVALNYCGQRYFSFREKK